MENSVDNDNDFNGAERLRRILTARNRPLRLNLDAITAVGCMRTLRPGRASRHSRDHANRGGINCLGASAASTAGQGATGNKRAAALDHYLAAASHVRDTCGDLEALARQAMARFDVETKCFHAGGGVHDCAAGEYSTLAGHPEIDRHRDEERRFVVSAQHMTVQNNLSEKDDARVERQFARNGWHVDTAALPLGRQHWFGAGEFRCLARMTCVRCGIAFVPAYDPRVDLPHPQLQSAIVVGAPGEAVHCDAMGRVKVRFAPMREEVHAHAGGAGASGLDRDSAWVRVANSWAGSGHHFGALALPRCGTEVLVALLGGDLDKPIIIGQPYNASARPPYLGGNDLPVNKSLSGIKTREINGARANQMRFDNTAGQISAQSSSDHGRSELNLGWLTRPREQGAGAADGQAKLTTGAQLALRAGKGMSLSAWKRRDGGGKQLVRADCLALMEDCLDLFRSLGNYAAQHQASPVDEQAQGELQAATKDWSRGSITAPAGIGFATSQAIVSYAARNIDSVARQHVQVTAGQRFNVNAGKGVSLFAQNEGLSAIAHHGKLLMQSQHDSTQIDSANDVRISARGRVIIMADDIVLINSAGAYLSLKDGAPEIGGPGPMRVKTAGHHWDGPASKSAELPTFGDGNFARTPRLLRGSDGLPVKEMELTLQRDGAAAVSGVTDGAGAAGKIEADHVEQLAARFRDPSA